MNKNELMIFWRSKFLYDFIKRTSTKILSKNYFLHIRKQKIFDPFPFLKALRNLGMASK